MIVLLASIKIMYFVRIYEDYGFLVQMVILTIKDLKQFLHALQFAIIFFAVLFMVLEVDIEDELKGVTGPGFNHFVKIYLQTYRITMGEIGVPSYKSLTGSKQSGFIQ